MPIDFVPGEEHYASSDFCSLIRMVRTACLLSDSCRRPSPVKPSSWRSHRFACCRCSSSSQHKSAAAAANGLPARFIQSSSSFTRPERSGAERTSCKVALACQSQHNTTDVQSSTTSPVHSRRQTTLPHPNASAASARSAMHIPNRQCDTNNQPWP
jgi:hypothetical protein